LIILFTAENNAVSLRDAPDTDLDGYPTDLISGSTCRLLVKYNISAMSKGQLYECVRFKILTGGKIVVTKDHLQRSNENKKNFHGNGQKIDRISGYLNYPVSGRILDLN
jgi:hypothetical protein